MAPASPRHGLLIVRAGRTLPGRPQIRITRVVGRRELPVVAVDDVDQACRVIRRWLEDLFGPASGGHRDIR
jgi:hypothetical protein